MFKNPILPGFYPDPSICRVGDDYYLVTSTFEYFPGIPIFHSKDLVNWEQIGNVLDRAEQLDLDDVEASAGLYAPSIRYNNGTFYVINTNVSKDGNFIVTAKNPSGPWSNPFWLGTDGIDPSLFFDDDGKAYYVGQRPKHNAKYDGDCEIYVQEIDLDKMKVKGEPTVVWDGALKDSFWAEGPHLYKVNGYYYLMIAEGCTDYPHSVTIARAEKVFGTYVGCPNNPVLTHRHLGVDYPIVNVGHADMVETQNGEWWMVMLASRPIDGYYRNLGRETFLAKVDWENGWPIINKGYGKVLEESPISPSLPSEFYMKTPACDNFEDDKLGFEWITIRTPRKEFYSLSERFGYLRLKLMPETVSERKHCSFIGRRLRHKNYIVRTAFEFKTQSDNETAGIAVLQNNNFHFRVEYGNGKITLTKRQNADEVLAQAEFNADKIYLAIEARGQNYNFYYGDTPKTENVLFPGADGRILSTDVAGGFVGAVIGMYASSNGEESSNYADFDWFEYYGE